MNIKANGRSALIIIAGLWMCFAGPMRATESTARSSDTTAKTDSTAGAPVALNKFTKQRKHVAEHPRKSDKVASKTSDSKKADDADAAQNASGDATPSTIPPSVANANAQLQAGDTAADKAVKTMSAQADNVLKAAQQGGLANASAANTELVSADQLNDVDRSLSDDKVPAPTLAMAAVQTPSTASNDDSTWNQTSLIGKIFIAFGGFLTLASAARMFMA